MGADFIGMTAISSAGIDAEYFLCLDMIIVGYIVMKKCTAKWLSFMGRFVFAVGYGLFLWMILWQIAPGIMAQVVYGLRI